MYNMENRRLIIVSNRLPVVIKKNVENKCELSRASGGLVTAITPILKRDGGVWIGWAGNYLEENIKLDDYLKKEEENLNYKYRSVDISLSDYELYYKGFCNEILWPLFHNISLYCIFEANYYEAFKKINKKFAQVVINELVETDFIWVHDYHLINTGKELREMGVKNDIAFFLHIPFPPFETFNRIPWRLEIIDAMLSYDLVGFQTQIDKKNFLEAVDSLTSSVPSEQKEKGITKIVVQNKEHKVGVFPISIDYDEFHDQLNNKEDSIMVQTIRENYPNQKIILGVDRLDYSKGIPQKLRAYKRLLEKNKYLQKKVKLIQIVVPSREDIAKYIKLKSEIEQLVGEINGKFSQPGWIPIQYCYHALNRKELISYYRVSDIALVTPLKDGMNLVAKEYCAANINKDGVLILSEFAGTSQQFKDNALLINVFDKDSIVNAIKEAIYMKKKDKKRRMENMQNNVQKFDIYWWVDTFIKAVKT